MSNSAPSTRRARPLSTEQTALLRLVFDLAQAGYRPDRRTLCQSLGRSASQLLGDLAQLAERGLVSGRRPTLTFIGLTLAVSLPASGIARAPRAAA
jgi:hypothetical protein